MSNELTTFDFEEQAVRVMTIADEPWFMATDVCRVLGLADVSSALRGLDDDEKITRHNERGNPRAGIPHQFNIISESGLYALIFTSRKAKARQFRRWVTGEVLPAIRRTGRYEAEQALQASGRGELARMRSLLLTAGEGVLAKRVTPGQAQAIALTAQRYLETLKVEGEALGYEKVLGLPDGEGPDGLLPPRRKTAELLQDVPQPPLPQPPQDEPGLPDGSAEQQEALGGEASGQTGGLREGAQGAGEDDLSAIGYDPANPH